MIREHAARVRAGEQSASEYVQRALARCEELDKQHSFFTVITREQAQAQAQHIDKQVRDGDDPGPLAGVLVSVKDNLCVQGVETTACSRILRGYQPQFSATAVQRLVNAGAVIIGKTSMDAFGFGTFNQNVGLGYQTPTNPLDASRVTGGSSGGSAAATQALNEFAHVSLAESTGGSIECPAAYCGVYGHCPTYGLVSRNGLISYANSLDKVGVLACNPADISLVMQVISGPDEQESTSLRASPQAGDVETVGVVSDAIAQAEPAVRDAFASFVKTLESKGYDIVDVELPVTSKYGVAAYYVLAMCEASTNLASLSGLRYGQEQSKKDISFNEYFTRVRSKHFNTESKRRIMLGTFARMAGYRDAYYKKCTQLRTHIIQEYEQAFEKVDILLSPTMPTSAPTVDQVRELSPAQMYAMDRLTVGPNLAGIPHASVPLKLPDGLFAGAMVMGWQLRDEQVLRFTEGCQ